MITISKLNVEWSNKYHPKHNESRNKATSTSMKHLSTEDSKNMQQLLQSPKEDAELID
jgi:hypothetical protein